MKLSAFLSATLLLTAVGCVAEELDATTSALEAENGDLDTSPETPPFGDGIAALLARVRSVSDPLCDDEYNGRALTHAGRHGLGARFRTIARPRATPATGAARCRSIAARSACAA